MSDKKKHTLSGLGRSVKDKAFSVGSHTLT